MPERWTLRDSVFFLMLALMESSWLSLFVPVLIPRSRFLPMVWILIGMWLALLAGAWGIYLLARWEENPRRVWTWMVAIPLGVYVLVARMVLFPHASWIDLSTWRVVLVAPFDFLHMYTPTGILILVILWWWRSLGVVQPPTGSMYMGLRFRAEMLGLLVGLVLLHNRFHDAPVVNVWTFFFASLVALTLVRILGIQLASEEQARVFDRTWVGITVLTTGLTIGISALVAHVVTVDNALRVLRLLHPLYRGIAYMLVGLALVIGWVVGTVVGFLWHLFLGNTSINVNFSPLQIPQSPSAQPPTPVQHPFRELSWLMAYLRPAGGILLVLLVLTFIALSLRREWRRRTRVQEESTAVGDMGEVVVDVSEGVQSLLERLRDAWHYVRRYGVTPTFLAALSVHNIYINVLRLSAQVGYARQQSETPYEHCERLVRAYPTIAEDLKSIVDAFVVAHYGNLVINSDRLDALRQAWERIHATLSSSEQ